VGWEAAVPLPLHAIDLLLRSIRCSGCGRDAGFLVGNLRRVQFRAERVRLSARRLKAAQGAQARAAAADVMLWSLHAFDFTLEVADTSGHWADVVGW